MAKKTRRKGGMFRKATMLAEPVGRAALTFGKEYGKDYAQKKMPKIIKGIYDDPSLASDPKYLFTASQTIKTPPKFVISNDENINNENINPNIMPGGKSKIKRRKNKRKTRKNRKLIV